MAVERHPLSSTAASLMATEARPRLSFDPSCTAGPGATFAFGLASLAQVTNAGNGRRSRPLSARPEYSRAAY